MRVGLAQIAHDNGAVLSVDHIFAASQRTAAACRGDRVRKAAAACSKRKQLIREWMSCFIIRRILLHGKRLDRNIRYRPAYN